MERKIEIVSRELIKPLSPTPNHLRHFKFSYLDQMAMPMFTPLALFYPPPPEGGHDEVNSSRLLVLKKSLSETLIHFHPFSGRLKDNSIECNDEGVPFYEAFARDYQFQDVIRNLGTTEQFLPKVEGGLMFHNSDIPLLVQVTNFKCGGMAVGICASHKISDGATTCIFANAWAETARDTPASNRLVPEFVAAAEFLPPPVPHVPTIPMSPELAKFHFGEKRVTKLFTFGASAVVSLKAKAVSDSVKAPTRVEAVSALLWKCAMVVNSGNDGTRPSQMAHLVNIRKRLDPPLPNYSVGNASSLSIARKSENYGSDLPDLVTCIRKGLAEMSSIYADKQKRDEAILDIPCGFTDLAILHSRGENELQITSFCGFQSYVDFGWGKPSWVSSYADGLTNLVLLLDSRDGTGIEAFVCLKDNVTMSAFEVELDKQLLAYESAK